MSRNRDLRSWELSIRFSDDFDIRALSVVLDDVDISKVESVPFPSKNSVIGRGEIRGDSERFGLKIHQVALVPLSDFEPFLLSIR